MAHAPRPTIVVITPVRNEAGNLRRFVDSASLWADHIILADQHSEDGSLAIVAGHPKVTVIDNPHLHFSEADRQRLLIDAARRLVPAPRLLVALDADELLSANVLESQEWRAATHTPPGTVLALAKVDLYLSPRQYCLHSARDRDVWMPFAYLDDDAGYTGGLMHAPRLPTPPAARWMRLDEVVVLHYNCVDVPRLASKNRWYRCFERVTFPSKHLLDIERRYSWFERPRSTFDVRDSDPAWFTAYTHAGIDVTCAPSQPPLWWDWEVLRLFKLHGTAPFHHLDIWSVDWEELRRVGRNNGIHGLPETPIPTPMRCSDRLIRLALRHSHKLRPRRMTDWILTHLATG